MWPWRRKATPTPATLSVSRAEWRALPPIGPILPTHPLVNPVRRFTDSLASWQDPSFLEPLGHQTGPAEPAGVADLATPATPPAAMPFALRPRRPSSSAMSRLWGAVAQRDTTSSEPVPPAGPSSADTHDGPPADLPRTLGSDSRRPSEGATGASTGDTVTVARLPMTAAPMTVRPTPAAEPVPTIASAPFPVAAPPDTTSASVPDRPTAEPASPQTDTADARPELPSAALVASRMPTVEGPQPLSPLIGTKLTAPTPADLPMLRLPLATAPEVPTEALVAEPDVELPDLTVVPTAAASVKSDRSESSTAVQRQDVVRPTHPVPPEPALPQPSVQRRLGLGVPIIPLASPERAGDRPLTDTAVPAEPTLSAVSPSVELQRAPDGVDDRTEVEDGHDVAAVPTSLVLPPTAVAESVSDTSKPTLGSPPPRESTLDPPAAAQPAPHVDPPTPLAVSRLVSNRAPATTDRAASQVVDPTPIVQTTQERTTARHPAEPRPVPTAVQRAERYDTYPAPNLALSLRAPAVSAPQAAQLQFSEPPPVSVVAQREVSDPEPASAEAEPTGPPAEPVPTPAPASAASTAAPPTSPAAGGDPEELVKKLFDPLLRRLKTELRLDRERRGRLTDLRQ